MEIKKFEKLNMTERVGLSTYIISMLFIIINSLLSFFENGYSFDGVFITEIILATIIIISFSLSFILRKYNVSTIGFFLFIVYAFLDIFGITKQYFFGIGIFLNSANFVVNLVLMITIADLDEDIKNEDYEENNDYY